MDSSSESSGSDPSTTLPSTTASDPTGADASTSEGGATTDDGSTSDDGSGSTGDPAIPCAGACVVAPEGWNGPVVLAHGGAAAAECGDTVYAHAQVAGYGDVDAPAAVCGCECTVDEELVCDPTLYRHSVAACDDAPAVIGIDIGCTNIVTQPEGYFEWGFDVSGGGCDASASIVVPPFQPADHLAACGTTEVAEGTCEGDAACVPSPAADAPLCFWAEGDVPCPETLTGTRELVYTSEAVDDRGCEECSCAAPTGWCEHPNIVLFGANNICDGSGGQQPPPAAVDAGDCVHYTAGATSVGLYGDPVPHTVCEPAAPPQATGGVAPQGPITVCCDA